MCDDVYDVIWMLSTGGLLDDTMIDTDETLQNLAYPVCWKKCGIFNFVVS